jgi:hypothetical protein
MGSLGLFLGKDQLLNAKARGRKDAEKEKKPWQDFSSAPLR